MTCGEARRIAWPDNGPQVVNDSIAGAERHIADCAACQAFMADMRAVADRVAAAAPRPSAPLEVRERLFDAVARARFDRDARRERRTLRRRISVAAAAVLLLVSAGLWRVLAPRGGATESVARLAEDHRRALGNEGIASEDTAAVSSWLSNRVGFAVHVPLFSNGTLRGARLYDADGRLGAAIAYRVDGHEVTYYVLPAGAGGRRDAGGTTGEPDVRVSSWAGYRLALWREPGLAHVIVAELPAERVRALAHECIRQMMAVGASPGVPPASRSELRAMHPERATG